MEEGRCHFDALQAKALEVLQEQQDTDAGLLLYNLSLGVIVKI